ncbi:MAG: hypothetical protein P8N54_03180, partial [Flavobacteriales bacterium]|nr:hypothetical protein [Flavobacteriales bacterium]
LKIVFAFPERMPEAQHTIRTQFKAISFGDCSFICASGMFSLPLMCPDLYSASERTSIILAPDATSVL